MEDWIHINPNSGQGNDTVEITVDANTSSEDRQASVDIKTSTLNKILSIIQKGADMANIIAFYLPNDSSTNAKGFFNNEEVTFAELFDKLKYEVQHQTDLGKLVINPYEIYIIKELSDNSNIIYKINKYRVSGIIIIIDIFDSPNDLIDNKSILNRYILNSSSIQLANTDAYEITLSSYSLNKTQVMMLVSNELNMSLADVKYYFDNQLPIPVIGEEVANSLVETIQTSFSSITCTVEKRIN